MILEEINGTVVVTVIRENGNVQELTVGEYFSDHERSSLTVTGTGKIIVRVDDNCTLEFSGVEPESVVEEVVAEVVVPETAPVVAETPVIIQPAKAPTVG